MIKQSTSIFLNALTSLYFFTITIKLNIVVPGRSAGFNLGRGDLKMDKINYHYYTKK
jgi:hypothetical protein